MPETAQRETALALTRKAASLFDERGFENARLEAELLLANVLGVRRLDLYLQYDRPVEGAALECYRESVRRRLRREPLQYVTGEAAFRSLVLRVDRRVLIPRPETELLAGEVIAWARGRSGLAAADIGTGSGAIALSLLAEGGFERVVATDVSADALAVASANAAWAGLGERLELRQGELLDALPAGQRFDAIVSNPPYVAESDRASLPAEVRDWEPEVALFAPNDGLGLLHRLVDTGPERLRAGGLLALEVGAGQAQDIAARLRRDERLTEVRIVADFAGHERIVLARAS